MADDEEQVDEVLGTPNHRRRPELPHLSLEKQAASPYSPDGVYGGNRSGRRRPTAWSPETGDETDSVSSPTTNEGSLLLGRGLSSQRAPGSPQSREGDPHRALSDSELVGWRRRNNRKKQYDLAGLYDVEEEYDDEDASSGPDDYPATAPTLDSPLGYSTMERPGERTSRLATLKKWVGKGPKTTGGPRVGKRVRARDYSKPYESTLAAEMAFDSGLPEIRVAAYCISAVLDVQRLAKWVRLTGGTRLPSSGATDKGRSCDFNLYLGAFHVSLVPEESEEEATLLNRRDIFFFTYGCVVFWGTTEEEEQQHLAMALDFAQDKTLRTESDDMLFRYGDRSSVTNDVITLTTADPKEKLSFSFAMAQSVKLDMFESRVEDVIEEYRSIPSNMDKIMRKLSQRDLSKMIGKIFLERADINLNSDILDEPDFFWESDEWLPQYRTMVLYLEVNSRVALLNAKLDILKELLGVLNSQVHHLHGTKLEWIVIWLIVASVAAKVFWQITVKDILGLFHNHSGRQHYGPL